ncbi:MAG: hypothetical protein ACR2IF_08405 [Terriglobales bacterium]
MGFEQAAIPIQKGKEFGELIGAIEKVFAPGYVEKFLAAAKSKGVRVRDWQAVLAKRVLERLEPGLKKPGRGARQLYEALAVSDQGQVREFYLSQVERVPGELRHKFRSVYLDA